MELKVLIPLENDLGECPTWDHEARRLYWTDIRKQTIFGCDENGETLSVQSVSNWVGSFVLRHAGALLMGNRKSLTTLNLAAGDLDDHLTLEADLPRNRINDGRCDRYGRYWFGTMDDREDRRTGGLYCCEALEEGSLKVTRVLDDIGVPNTLSFSPDGRKMYFADSTKGDILRFDLNPEDCALPVGELFFSKEDAPGAPDGATVDADGCLWHTRYGAGQVIRLTPEGKVDLVLQSDTQNLTACAFGGARLDRLFVTTARQHMTPDALNKEPDAGSLLVADTRFQGLPEPRFGRNQSPQAD